MEYESDQELMLAPDFPRGDSLSEIVRSVRSEDEREAVVRTYERVARELSSKWNDSPVVLPWEEGDDPLQSLLRTLSSERLEQLRA